MNELNEIQKQILRLHACGSRVKDIAVATGLSNHHIQYNVRVIYKKLDVVSIPHAIAKLSGFTI